MIAKDEEALICDLAETYHIYDYKRLPADQVAVFSVGLGEDSRIRKSMEGRNISNSNLIQAAILDRLSILVWMKTKDGQKGINKPQMMVNLLTEKPKESNELSFETSEEFENAKRQLLAKLEGGGNGN